MCALMFVLNSMAFKTVKQNAFPIQVYEMSEDKIEVEKVVVRIIRIVSIMRAKQPVKRAMASHVTEPTQ